MFTQHGDLKFLYDGNKPADVNLAADGKTLERDPGLETCVLISLFTDGRADAEDNLSTTEDNSRGWWGDSLTGFNIGSKIWLLGRSKITAETEALLADYNEKALQWLIDEDLVDSIVVACQRNGLHQIDTIIKIIKKDNSNVFFKYYLNWKAQIFGGL